jgi:hypothetical protein
MLKQREGCVVGCIHLTQNRSVNTQGGNPASHHRCWSEHGGWICSSAITDDHTSLRVDKDTKSLHNLLCIRSFHNWKTEATVSALTVQKQRMYIFPMYHFHQSILNHQTEY